MPAGKAMKSGPCSNARFTPLILIAICSGFGLPATELRASGPADDPVQALPAFGKGEAMPEMDELFRNKDGWIGADGAHSFPISDTKTIWLFSDTWIGKVRDGKRTDATLVNTAWRQEARQKSKVEFIVREPDGAMAFITADGKGYYWPRRAIVEKKAICCCRKSMSGEGSSVQTVAQWIGINPRPSFELASRAAQT